MAIKFFSDKIQIGDYNLFEGNGGIQFDGVARAENFLSVSPTQGNRNGYTASGVNDPAILNTIQKFPFAIDTNGSDVGDLTVTRRSTAGSCSKTHGYVAGGTIPSLPGPSNTIEKWPFSSDSNASDVGDLIETKDNIAGLSSTISGYASGGRLLSPGPGATVNTIEKWPFPSDSNASDVGDLSQARWGVSSASSPVFGYVINGFTSPAGTPVANTIDKFPFATDTNATDVGDMAPATRQDVRGLSSAINGYILGGETPPGAKVSDINRFPFATNSNATDTADLTVAGQQLQTSASVTHGYGVGGDRPGVSSVGANTIDKFLFATDSNATDVGDLAQSVRSGNSGAISS